MAELMLSGSRVPGYSYTGDRWNNGKRSLELLKKGVGVEPVRQTLWE